MTIWEVLVAFSTTDWMVSTMPSSAVVGRDARVVSSAVDAGCSVDTESADRSRSESYCFESSSGDVRTNVLCMTRSVEDGAFCVRADVVGEMVENFDVAEARAPSELVDGIDRAGSSDGAAFANSG